MKKINIILDTDIGADCDDMLALAYLVYAKRNLGVNIKAITYAQTCKHGIPMLRVMFRQMGEELPALGMLTHASKYYDNYTENICKLWAKESDYEPVPEAFKALRRALAESSEKTTVCAIGPLTNISDLLLSPADEISPLDGISLVKEKCDKLVIMAGGFIPNESGKNTPEWNAKIDIEATQNVAALCPVPLVWLPFETGLDMKTGGFLLGENAKRDALTYSFVTYPYIDSDGRHSWDPATLMYAVEGVKDFLSESKTGSVTVDENGATEFTEYSGGLHTVLTLRSSESKAECAAYLDNCVKEVVKSNV